MTPKCTSDGGMIYGKWTRILVMMGDANKMDEAAGRVWAGLICLVRKIYMRKNTLVP